LHTGTGKEIYYKNKLNVESWKDREEVCRCYLKGLAWIYSYYSTGVKSWEWFYPYHYAPFAIDLCRIKDYKPSFTLGRALKQLEQIVVVMPPMSKGNVPVGLHSVYDENKDVYPDTVKIDMFDKLLPWQGVVLLPFVDTKKLVRSINRKMKDVDLEDIYRNVESANLLYVGTDNPFYKTVYLTYSEFKPYSNISERGFIGRIFPYSHSPLPGDLMNFNNSSKSYKNECIAVHFATRKENK
jgi:5'-3' exoribonuclease 2